MHETQNKARDEADSWSSDVPSQSLFKSMKSFHSIKALSNRRVGLPTLIESRKALPILKLDTVC